MLYHFAVATIQVANLVNNDPVHEISINVLCATSKASDQPAHTRSLIRAFAGPFEYSMIVKLLTEYLWSF